MASKPFRSADQDKVLFSSQFRIGRKDLDLVGAGRRADPDRRRADCDLDASGVPVSPDAREELARHRLERRVLEELAEMRPDLPTGRVPRSGALLP